MWTFHVMSLDELTQQSLQPTKYLEINLRNILKYLISLLLSIIFSTTLHKQFSIDFTVCVCLGVTHHVLVNGLSEE